jgi:hypothetical protein
MGNSGIQMGVLSKEHFLFPTNGITMTKSNGCTVMVTKLESTRLRKRFESKPNPEPKPKPKPKSKTKPKFKLKPKPKSKPKPKPKPKKYIIYKLSKFSHRTLANKPISEWKEEMDGMRQALEKFSYVDASKVIGVRSPQLATGGILENFN